jgi:hypothetical protein
MQRAAMILVFASTGLYGQGTFEGSVLNSINGQPVSGATVDVFAEGAKDAIGHTVTGPGGTFRISSLPPGEYKPAFDADAFFASHAGDPWSKSFAITEAGETIHADAELDPSTKLSGRVLDGDGKPLAGVRVETFTRTTRQGVMSFLTDKDGYFHPPELQPGAYFLVARPNRGLTIGKNLKVNEPELDKPEKQIWAPTFYPGVSDVTQAQAILATGGELSGYDIRLRAIPVYRVRGVLRDETGNPAPNVPVALRNSGLWYLETFSRPDAETVTGADGSFDFADVGPGTWRVDAEWKRGDVDLHGSRLVTVSRHDEEDVRVRLDPPFTLQGSAEGPASIKLKGVYVTPLDGPRLYQSYADIVGGRFLVKGLYPGAYTLQNASVEGVYLAQVRLGEQDVTGKPLDLAPGAPPLHLVYRSDTGSVRGRVEKGGNASVVLFTDGESPSTVRCAPDGTFEFKGLKPGDYSAVAFNRVEPDLLDDPVVRQAMTRNGVSVRVDPGRSASLELALTAWVQ